MSKVTATIKPASLTVTADAAKLALSLGSSTKHIDAYEGEYAISVADEAQVLETVGKKMLDNVTVEGIPAYTGAYSATPIEESQTLGTAGKRLAEDVTVEAIPAAYKDMSGDYAWLGPDVQDFGEIYRKEVTLENTNFDSCLSADSPIISSFSKEFESRGNYEHMIRWDVEFAPAYVSGATPVSVPARQVYTLWQVITECQFVLQYEASTAYNAWLLAQDRNSSYVVYYDASGNKREMMGVTANGTGCGVYPIYNFNSNYGYRFRALAPTIRARCDGTVMSVSGAQLLDKANSIIRVTGRLFGVPLEYGFLRKTFGHARDLYNDTASKLYLTITSNLMATVYLTVPNNYEDIRIDFGDGTDPVGLQVESGDMKVFTAYHSYGAAGSYVVKIYSLGGNTPYALGGVGLNANYSIVSARPKIDTHPEVRRFEFGTDAHLASMEISNLADNSAFATCTQLTELKLPACTRRIPLYCFQGCNSMSSITIYATTPPTVDDSDGDAIGVLPSKCVFYVPPSAVDDYKAAKCWSDRASYIRAIEEDGA